MSTANNVLPPANKGTSTPRKRPASVVSVLKRLDPPLCASYSTVTQLSTRTIQTSATRGFVTCWTGTSALPTGPWLADSLDESALGTIESAVRMSVLPTAITVTGGLTRPEPVDLPSWLNEVWSKLTELLRLPENWDSYGARRIRLDCVWYALNEVLIPCMQVTTPAPAVVPLNTGGVMLEWHCCQIDLEVRVEESGHVHMYFADAKDDTEIELDLDDNLVPLAVALLKLTQRT